jgi:hypothetical protein
MKNIIFLDYDSEREGNEIRIGKPNQEVPIDKGIELEILTLDVDLLTDGLIKLTNEAHKLGFWDKSVILDNIIGKLLKEKYDKSGESVNV